MLTLLLVLYILMSIQTWIFPFLSLFLFSLLSTRFSRCCSTWESANPVAVAAFATADAATLVLAVASDCRAAASAAAAAARHACSVCVSFFCHT